MFASSHCPQLNMSGEDPDLPKPDEVEELTGAQILIDKAERVFLGFFYALLFGLAVSNVWQYLIKKKMYRSVPMLVTYILLLIFSGISAYYEFFMGFGCLEHDCMSELLINLNKEKSDFTKSMHQGKIV